MIEEANPAARVSRRGAALPPEGGEISSRKQSRRVLIAAKIGFTVLAFVLLARVIDPSALLDRIRRTEPIYFLAALLLAIVQIPFVGVRWRLIVQTMSKDARTIPGMGQFQQINYIAQFFAQVLPFVAGDGVRVLFLREAGATLRVAFKSTLLDRGIAALVLFALTLPGILFSPVLQANNRLLAPIAAFAGAGLLGAILVIALAPHLGRIAGRSRVLGAIIETLLDLRGILLGWGSSGRIVGLCILVHAISIVVFWLLARGQDMPILLVDAAAVVPLMLLVSMIPVAIGGWGVREGFLVALLGAAGIGPESALLLSVSFGTVSFLASLPGVVLLGLSARTSANAATSSET